MIAYRNKIISWSVDRAVHLHSLSADERKVLHELLDAQLSAVEWDMEFCSSRQWWELAQEKGKLFDELLQLKADLVNYETVLKREQAERPTKMTRDGL